MGYRKFALAVLIFLGATFLCFTGHIADGVYSTIILADLAGFFTANVTQKKLVSPPVTINLEREKP